MGFRGQRHPDRFTIEKEIQYLLSLEAALASVPVWTVWIRESFLSPPGIKPRIYSLYRVEIFP